MSPSTPNIDTESGCKAFLEIYRDGLLNDTLPFWIPRAEDNVHGGFQTARGRAGELLDTDKSVWAQGRFSWLLGELFNTVEPNPDWLRLAKSGCDFMIDHCFDPLDGRMWFHVSDKGLPIRKRRYSFTESFAAIAFGELAKATGQQKYREFAEKSFDQFVQGNLSPQGPAKFTGVRPGRGIGFPMILVVTAQQLRESIGLESANHWIDFSIDLIRRYHLKPDIRCVMETVGLNGEIIDHFDQRTLNPGHAIEAAWFLMAEGAIRSDPSLVQTGLQMLDWMWERGWDEEHGGILYFVDLHGGPVQEYWHDMKFWWPHNETIIATLLAFLLTGDSKYARWHSQVHAWAYDHFPDSEFGEWYGYLRNDGSVSSDLKGNLWKGPFHLPRMQLVCWKMLENKLAGQPIF